jgi:hypothetical protein
LKRASYGIHAAAAVLDESQQYMLGEAAIRIGEKYREAIDDYEALPAWRRAAELIIERLTRRPGF